MSKNAKKEPKSAKAPGTAGKKRPGYVEEESFTQRLYYSILRMIRHARRRWWDIQRARREHHFPESDRFLIKLVLLVWGQIPMVFSRLAEGTARLNRRAVKSAEKEFPWLERHHIHPAALLAAGCVVASLAMFFTVYTRGTVVLFEGAPMGSVSSKAVVEKVCEDLEAVSASVLGSSYEIDRENFESAELQIRETLSGFERQVLEQYIEGKSYQEIAAELDRTAKSIDNALQRTKAKLEKKFNGK